MYTHLYYLLISHDLLNNVKLILYLLYHNLYHAAVMYCFCALFILVDDSVYLRCCQSSLDPSLTVVVPMITDSPVKECRKHCAQSDFTLSVVKAAECYCWTPTDDQLGSLPSAPDVDCASEQFSVYRITSALSLEEVLYPINLSVDVVKATDYSYIRPGETVVFLFTTDTEESVTFDINFGDGRSKLTIDPRTSYAWLSEGTYNVTLTASTRTTTETIQEEVSITWVDEGVAPELVLLKSSITSHVGDGTVDFYLTAISHELLSCDVNLGDGSDETFSGMDLFINRQVFQHTYDLPGFYDLFVSCVNVYGTRNFTSQIVVANDVVELQTGDRSINISVPFKDGDDDSLIVEVNKHIVTSAVVDERNVTVPSSAFPYSGQHLIELKADDITLSKTVVTLQNQIERVDIDTSGISHAMREEEYAITFKVYGGDYIHAQLDFGDGGFEFVYIDAAGDVAELVKPHTYSNLGVYTISIQAANDVSFKMITKEVSIEEEVSSAHLSVNHQTVLGESTNFIIVTSGADGGVVVPVDVTFDYGDGKIETLSLGSLDNPSAVMVHSYIYEDYGWYNVSALVHNNLGEIVLFARHQVGQDIGYMDISADKERLPLGQEVQISIDSPAGSPSIFTVDLGDGSIANISVPEDFAPEFETVEDEELTTANGEVFRRKRREVRLSVGDGSSWNETTTAVAFISEEVVGWAAVTETPIISAPEKTHVATNDIVVVKHTYRETGRYSVKATVRNPFNSAESWLCPDILVLPADVPNPDCTSFQVTPTRGATLDAPLITNRSLPLTIELTYLTDCGEVSTSVDYTWSAQWLTDSNTWRPELNICEEPISEDVYTIPGNTLWYGTYRLSARAGLRVNTPTDEAERKRREVIEDLTGVATLITVDADVYVRVDPSPLVAAITLTDSGEPVAIKTVTTVATVSMYLKYSYDPGMCHQIVVIYLLMIF